MPDCITIVATAKGLEEVKIFTMNRDTSIIS